MKQVNVERRQLIRNLGLAGVGAAAAGLAMSSAAKAALLKTPAQPEGPFYPVKDQLDKDADMTHVRGRTESALGEKVLIHGMVLDNQTGKPVAGAVVEFWQACESGKYDHPSDPNTAPLDPNFQYWAQVQTDATGAWKLLTIRPGPYPADDTWVRPPHIHVKVHKAGYPSLTTQLYFKGDPLNDSDLILNKLTPAQRELVTLELKPKGDRTEANWSIYIQSRQGKRNHNKLQSSNFTATPEIE